MTSGTIGTTTAGDRGGDKPTGAGAAPDRKHRPPRAHSQRGSGKNRKPEFYAHLGQRPAALRGASQAAQNVNDRQRGHHQAAILTGLREAGRAITTTADRLDDEGLGEVLAAVAAEVQLEAGLERAGILGSYAARVRYARKHYSRAELAGALQALKRERQAALAALSRRTALQMRGRLLAARRQHGRPPRPRA